MYLFINITQGMMIVRFDVCHDKQNTNILFGALVAKVNDTHTRYFSCVQQNGSGQELSYYFSINITCKYIYFSKLLKEDF